VGHLDKEQVGDLLDIVTVIDTVMPKRITKTPEFADNVCHREPPPLLMMKTIDITCSYGKLQFYLYLFRLSCSLLPRYLMSS